jgi:hypothetical protein
MTSLPLRVPKTLRDIADVVDVYDICLRLEKSFQLAVDKGEDVRNNLIYIRILGYLIHYVPTNQGLKNIVEEITSCADDSALLDVGKIYFDHFIRACTFSNLCSAYDLGLMCSPVRANRSPIPTPSNHESPPSFDTLADLIKDTLVDAPQSHTDAKMNVGLLLSFHE